MAKISTNNIPNIEADWGLDEKTGLPYSGQAVQKFIKDTLNEKTASVYFDSGKSALYAFRSESDKEAWLESGDESLVLSFTAVTMSGTVYDMQAVNKMGSDFGTMLYFPSNSNEALLKVGYQSFMKRMIDTDFTEVKENAYFTVKIDRGKTGKYETIVNRQLVLYGSDFEYNIRNQLNPGNNAVEITIVGASTNASNFVTYDINLTSMYIADADFKWYNTFVEGQPYSIGGLYIGGDISKKIHIKISNEELGYLKQYDIPLGTAIYTTNAYYYEGLEFPNTGSGIYSLEIWVDTDGFGTNHLFYDIICVASSEIETAKFVAINNSVSKVDNFVDNKLFEYCVYDGGSTTASPELTVTFDGEIIVDELLTGVLTNSRNSYTLSLELETEEIDISADIAFANGNVIAFTLPIDNSRAFPATKGASFYLNAASRNNSQLNKTSVINSVTNEEISTEWTGLTWVDGYNGWTVDNNGRKSLSIPAMARANINYQPLSEIPATGKTIEFVFKTSNIADYDEPIIQILEGTTDSFKGILIRPTQIVVRSRDRHSDLNQSYNFKEEEVIDLTISIVRNYKVTYGNLAMIYANGVKVCEFEFDTSDDWTAKSNVILGSNYADLHLYKMRVYDTAFNSNAAITNYINSLSTPEEKVQVNDAIKSIVDDSGNISFELVSQKYNTMVVQMTSVDEVPHYGWEKERRETGNFEMIWPDNPEWNFKIENVGIEGQGTTSMNYWLWNLRVRLDKSDDAIVSYGGKPSSDNSSVWFDGVDNHPKLNRITAKKNYASSMHSHKMGATGAFNDLHHALGLDNEVGGRVAVYQYPAYAFQKILREGTQDEYVYRFIGLYTVGPDKGDKATFGYSDKTYKKQLIHLEGKDHGIKGVGFNYPWSEMKYVADKESLCVDKGGDQYDANWEVGASGSAESESDIQLYLDQEFKPAYESSYNCSTMILGTQDSISEINVDPITWGQQKTSDGHLFDRFDIWIDGEYDLYFFSKKTNQYEKNGINLLNQLGLTTSDLSGLSIDEKNELFKIKRREQFKSIASDYWDIDDCLFCYCFLLLFGATDNFQKNSYPYKFGNLVDGHRWRWRQDDLDTIFDIDNQGHATKKYSIEAHDWTDDTKAAYVFKGEDSTFWRLLGECYESEIKQMMHNVFGKMEELSGNSGNRLEKLIAFIKKYFWDKAQNYFTKSAYNIDGEYSYEEAWPQYKSGNYVVDVHPLDQAMGGHLEAELDWIEKRLIYMMSKFQYGAFNNYTERYLGVLTFRTQTGQTFELTPSMDIYPTILLGQGGSESCGRIKDGETGVIRNVGGNNTNIYLMAADYLKDIGDLSNITVEPGANVTLSIDAKRIDRVKIGDEDASKVTANLATLEIGDCPSVKVVDARNVTTLTGNVDLSQCPRLQEAYFGGTKVTGISIPNGSTIKKLQLPGTITTLKLQNLHHLESFECPNLTNIEYLWIENCPAIDAFGILKTIYNSDNNKLKDIRIVGIDETITLNDTFIFASLASNLDKDGNEHLYNGISSTGEPGGLPVIEGSIISEAVYYQDLLEINKIFPAVVLSSDNKYVKFQDSLVKEIVLTNFANGQNEITIEQVQSITNIGTVFNNTEIKYFNEFALFTGITTLSGWFKGCSSLLEVSTPKITAFHITSGHGYTSYTRYFEGCLSLEKVRLGSIFERWNITGCMPTYAMFKDSLNLKEVWVDFELKSDPIFNCFVTRGSQAILYINGEYANEMILTSHNNPWYGFRNVFSKVEVKTDEYYVLSGPTIKNDVELNLDDYFNIENTTFLGNVVISSEFERNNMPSVCNCTFAGEVVVDIDAKKISSDSYFFKDCVFYNGITLKQYTPSLNLANKNFTLTLLENYIGWLTSKVVSNAETIFFEKPFLFSKSDVQKNLYYKTKNGEYVVWDHPISVAVNNKTIPASSVKAMQNLILNIENLQDVTTVEQYAFKDCEINYPLDLSSVTSIGNYAFYNCKINDTFILRDVNSVGYNAFQNANAPLANFELMKITSVGSYGFSNFIGGNVKVNINTITTQDMYMFENSNIQLIGDEVTLRHSQYSFYKANLPETLTVNNVYSSYARCSNAKNTKNLILNASSYYFGDSDFARMPDLDTITINGDILVNASSKSPLFNSSGKTAIINGKVTVYNSSNTYAPFQKSTVHTAILNTNPSEYLFYSCSTLKNLYINCAIDARVNSWLPSATRSVYYKNLDDLLNSQLGTSLCNGGYYYINNDNGTITIPSNVSKINQYVFNNCANNIEIGDNVITEIGMWAFYNSKNLNEVINLPLLWTLDTSAFGKSSIKTFNAPLLTTIPPSCFSNSSLESVYLPKVETISTGAMSGCKLKELVLPSIKTLETNSLNMASLNKIICGSNITTIGNFYSSISTDTALSNLILNYKHLVCLNTTPPTMSGNWTTTGILTMFVPDESVELYTTATNAPVNIKPISEYFDYRPMTVVLGRYVSTGTANGAHHDKILDSNSNYRSVLTTCNAGEEFVCENLVPDFSYYLDSNGNILSQITEATNASNTLIVPEGATEMILCRNATSLAAAFKDYKNPLEGYEDYEW